ncbi:MAG TPA: hypothetical protein VFG37_13970, partial [Planctomycetota bacterium]|nr:hypothetical protein [Planctomycetota bacterium]
SRAKARLAARAPAPPPAPAPRAPQGRGAPSKAAARAAAAAHAAQHAHLHHPELLEKKPTVEPIVKIGFGIAGGLMILVLVVFFVVKGKHEAERKVQEQLQTARKEFIDYIRERTVGSEVNGAKAAQEILTWADSHKELWEHDEDYRSEVQGWITKSRVLLDQSQQMKDMEDKLAGVEAGLKNVAGLNVENVREMQTKLSELARMDIGTETFKKRVKDAVAECSHLYATKLHDDSIAFANGNASQPRLALNRYYQAEDELKNMLEAAWKAEQASKNPEERKFFEPLYKEVAEAGDRTAVQLFNDSSAIEGASQTDLLTPPQATKWNPKRFQALNGGLEIDGGAEGGKKATIVSILDLEQPRNFVLDLEFTIDKGVVIMYFHLGSRATEATPCKRLESEGQSQNVTPNKLTKVRMAVIGDQFTWRFLEDDLNSGELKETVAWNKSRKGAIGFEVNPGTKLRISKMKIKNLQ